MFVLVSAVPNLNQPSTVSFSFISGFASRRDSKLSRPAFVSVAVLSDPLLGAVLDSLALSARADQPFSVALCSLPPISAVFISLPSSYIVVGDIGEACSGFLRRTLFASLRSPPASSHVTSWGCSEVLAMVIRAALCCVAPSFCAFCCLKISSAAKEACGSTRLNSSTILG